MSATASGSPHNFPWEPRICENGDCATRRSERRRRPEDRQQPRQHEYRPRHAGRRGSVRGTLHGDRLKHQVGNDGGEQQGRRTVPQIALRENRGPSPPGPLFGPPPVDRFDGVSIQRIHKNIATQLTGKAMLSQVIHIIHS